MKKLSIAFLLAFFSLTHQANAQNYDIKTAKVAGLSSNSVGPKGFGWFLIGMNQDELTPGKEIEGFSINSELKLFISKYPLPPGFGRLMSAAVQTPLGDYPKQMSFTFDKSKLVAIAFGVGGGNTGSENLKKIEKLITEKYGNPVVKTQNMVDVECAYKNGAKFNYKKGANTLNWYSLYDEDLFIETSIIDDASFSGCPENLIKDEILFNNRSFSTRIQIVRINSKADINLENQKKAF